MNCTMFVCSHCGKDLKSGEKEHCEKLNTRLCAQCEYLECLGVHNIAQYNAWLRGEWSVSKMMELENA